MTQDTDYHYALLMEGKLDLMHLPAGAVAWLWQYNRPDSQVDSAMRFATTAHHMGDPVEHAALLRADHNVMVIHTQSGLTVSVYPDGGLGSNGEPIPVDSLEMLFSGGLPVEPEAGAVDPMPEPLGGVPIPV